MRTIAFAKAGVEEISARSLTCVIKQAFTFSELADTTRKMKQKVLLNVMIILMAVTYLFYLVMGMHNELFLVYVSLVALTFYSFILLIQSFNVGSIAFGDGIDWWLSDNYPHPSAKRKIELSTSYLRKFFEREKNSVYEYFNCYKRTKK